jgi:hypothetical protein
MAGLDDIISSLAADLAQSIRERRLLGYIEATVATPDPHHSLWPTLERAIAKHDRIEAAVSAGWHRLEKNIGGVLRLAESGSILARSAKIEAAYGGGMTRLLTEVAEQVETAIADIGACLANIRKLTASEDHRP